MYNNKDNEFHCDICNKVIETGEKCWVKWKFPPNHLKSQMMPTKAFQFENSPILCSLCSNKDIIISDF